MFNDRTKMGKVSKRKKTFRLQPGQIQNSPTILPLFFYVIFQMFNFKKKKVKFKLDMNFDLVFTCILKWKLKFKT